MAGDRAVMTVLEGIVPEGRWEELVRAFEGAGGKRPAPLLRSYLVRDAAEPSRCRLIAVWRSRGALEEYRRSVPAPGGVLMFRAVGVEPALSIWEVGSAGPPLGS